MATVAIGALALPSTALAAPPPKPDDPTIVPAASIGGATVGQLGADAEAAWGGAGRCEETQPGQRDCKYGSRKKGNGVLLEPDGVVFLVSIQAPFSNGEFKFTGPLSKFRTAEGNLGLGSKLTKVAKMFPKARVIEKRSVTIKGDGAEMEFFSSDGKHVTQIVARDLGIN